MKEQGRRTRAHLERVLLVSGMQQAGKSHLLRNMYHDPRFGTQRVLPTQARLKSIALSYARYLQVRLSSPHETSETLNEFLNTIDRAGERAWSSDWRFNFACAVQPHKTAKTPDVITICRALRRQFSPERIRIVQIDPTQGDQQGVLFSPSELRHLWAMDVEVLTVSGDRSGQRMSGWLLADYFDFT